MTRVLCCRPPFGTGSGPVARHAALRRVATAAAQPSRCALPGLEWRATPCSI